MLSFMTGQRTKIYNYIKYSSYPRVWRDCHSAGKAWWLGNMDACFLLSRVLRQSRSASTTCAWVALALSLLYLDVFNPSLAQYIG